MSEEKAQSPGYLEWRFLKKGKNGKKRWYPVPSSQYPEPVPRSCPAL